MDRFRAYLHMFAERVEEEIAKRVSFIQSTVRDSGAGGVVVGISGGIDSAVSAALCVRALGPERVIGIWMPISSQAVHEADARALAEAIGLNLWTVDLAPAFDQIVAAIETQQPLSDGSKGNTKARLRMTTLYAVANERGWLVADTCNRSEIYVGYMTKGGDGLADFNPLASLTKHEVRLLAKALGVPDSIIQKPPSADLWVGQTDEQEMGFTYEQLDRYLITGEGDSCVIERIEDMHRRSAHKRQLMPMC